MSRPPDSLLTPAQGPRSIRYRSSSWRLRAVVAVVAFALAGTASAETWRGLTVAPEHRCSPYDRKRDYPYPQSIEQDIVRELGASPKSIRHWFEGDPFNCAFASNLDRVIDRYQPELWIHGHMHDPVDEELGRTRLLANPAGYRHEAKRGFDPDLCVGMGATV